MARIILNAGHGGNDSGGVYNDRLEKDDNLRLAIAIGNILIKNGFEVYYTRVDDAYISPVIRTKFVNYIGGDLLVDLHRGFPTPTDERGARVYLDHYGGIEQTAAENVLKNLEKVGYRNNGVSIRNRIYLLENSKVPAFELIVGYINSEYDNQLFDEKLNESANAIAEGIKETFQ